MTETNKTPATEYEMRKLLNSLSKEVYGTSSKWQKLVNKGVVEPLVNPEIPYVTGIVTRSSLAEVYSHMVATKQAREAQQKAYAEAYERQVAEEAVNRNRKSVEDELTGSASS